MDENAYEAPRQVLPRPKAIRVRIAWWPIVLLIVLTLVLAALFLPAFQPGREFNEREYFEWKAKVGETERVNE